MKLIKETFHSCPSVHPSCLVAIKLFEGKKKGHGSSVILKVQYTFTKTSSVMMPFKNLFIL